MVPAQADSLERPLARRAFRIARPARVFIRALKPCFRFRRRLFGWNVRFVTTSLSVSLPHQTEDYADREIGGVLEVPAQYRRRAFFHVKPAGIHLPTRDFGELLTKARARRLT